MINHLQEEAAKYGLKMHAGKTKVLTNQRATASTDQIRVGMDQVEVLGPDAVEKYLGRKLCFQDLHKRKSCTEYVLVGRPL